VTRYFIAGALFLAGAASALGSTEPDRCVPSIFPAEWLEAQEASGGHTLAKHVGKNDEWLTNRLITETRIPAASSFTSVENARLAVRAALSANRDRINQWAKNAARNARRAWDHDGPEVIGHVLARGDNDGMADRSSDLRVVLRAYGEGGCLLLTAYPIPE
jgi:hypothetical protein